MYRFYQCYLDFIKYSQRGKIKKSGTIEKKDNSYNPEVGDGKEVGVFIFIEVKNIQKETNGQGNQDQASDGVGISVEGQMYRLKKQGINQTKAYKKDEKDKDPFFQSNDFGNEKKKINEQGGLPIHKQQVII